MANEQSCTLPREPLRRLRELGFARLRLPVEWGGLGATLPELFNLLIELSIADTSVTNALRAQWGFTEDLLNTPASPERELWVRRMLPASAPGFLSGLRIALTNGPALVQSLVDSGKPRVLLTNTDVDFPAGLATVVRTADLKDASREATIRDFFHRVRRWNDWKASHEAEVEKVLIQTNHLKPETAAYLARADINDPVQVDAAFLATEQRIADALFEAAGIPRRVDVSLQYDTRLNADIAAGQ